jgi:hypothetical protein
MRSVPGMQLPVGRPAVRDMQGWPAVGFDRPTKLNLYLKPLRVLLTANKNLCRQVSHMLL